MAKSKWMSGDEAIRHVMKSLGCSREQAILEIRKKVHAGKIKAFDKRKRPARIIEGDLQ